MPDNTEGESAVAPDAAALPPAAASQTAHRSSAGGAGNSGGESFRDDVAARIGVFMLVQMAMFEHSPVDAVPLRVSCEAAEHIDDIAITTRAGRLLIQAKGAKLDVPPNAMTLESENAFVKAVEQLVNQQSRVPGRPLRPLLADTDRFVIAYKDATKELGRLKEISLRLTAKTDADPEFEARPKVLRGPKDDVTFEKFSHVIEAIRGGAATWQELIQFLRLIIFWEVRPGITNRVEVDPNNLLRSVLADHTTREAAIEVISRHMMEVGADRKSIDADGLRDLLRRKQIQLQGTPDARLEVERIQQATISYLAGMRRRSSRPFGSRATREEVRTATNACEGGPIVVVGDRGMGKSTTLLELAEGLLADSKQVVVVDLRQARGDVFSAVGSPLSLPLQRILDAFPDPVPGYLLIDSLEDVRDDRALEKSTVELIEAALPRWRIVATARTSVMGNHEWKRLFKGEPLASTQERFLENVRHIRLGSFSRHDLDSLLAQAPGELRAAVANSDELRAFLSVPENLSMVAELAPAMLTQADATSYLKVAADAYWGTRVVYKNAAAREHAIVQLVSIQRETKATTVTLGALGLAGVAIATLDELEHDGVISRVAGKVSLTHEVLADFIWVMYQ